MKDCKFCKNQAELRSLYDNPKIPFDESLRRANRSLVKIKSDRNKKNNQLNDENNNDNNDHDSEKENI